MAVTEERLGTTQATYQLEGTLLEACNCGVLCPCWVGENPDEGECFAFNAYHFNRGQIRGIDVSGLNLVEIVHIPQNVLIPNSWRVVLLVDEKGTPKQREAIVGAFTGRFGGPLADVAGLVGEVLGIEYPPITHKVVGGRGTMLIPGVLEAELEPYRGPDGTITTVRDSLFSTVPGSPAYAAKASKNWVHLDKYGLSWEVEGRNAIQADYTMEFS